MHNFGDTLRGLRKNRSLSQASLASLLGLAQTTVSGYENGDRTPDLDTLCNIADFFQISLDQLTGRTP